MHPYLKKDYKIIIRSFVNAKLGHYTLDIELISEPKL
jgi:hypothetical protein